MIVIIPMAIKNTDHSDIPNHSQKAEKILANHSITAKSAFPTVSRRYMALPYSSFSPISQSADKPSVLHMCNSIDSFMSNSPFSNLL